eukprot:COSAG01_NODE_7770_length_3065_cov_1.949427_6_plen_160_part_00
MSRGPRGHILHAVIAAAPPEAAAAVLRAVCVCACVRACACVCGRQVFHPDLNLFSRTEDQRMYPCVASGINPEHLRLFHLAGRCGGRCVLLCGRFGWDFPRKLLFLSRNIEGATAAGRLFGRTVFEGIVADLPFANFMLAKLLHGHAFRDDLQSLDAQL